MWCVSCCRKQQGFLYCSLVHEFLIYVCSMPCFIVSFLPLIKHGERYLIKESRYFNYTGEENRYKNAELLDQGQAESDGTLEPQKAHSYFSLSPTAILHGTILPSWCTLKSTNVKIKKKKMPEWRIHDSGLCSKLHLHMSWIYEHELHNQIKVSIMQRMLK